MGQVTFDDLMFGDRDSRIAAWRLVVEMVETMAEEQLNQCWRKIMPDSAWQTPHELRQFAESKIQDIQGAKR